MKLENLGSGSNMKILLLGATGFVGRHLLRRLARDGHRMTVLTRYRPGCRDVALIPGVRLVQADPYDTAGLISLLRGHDAAVNLVGILNERGFGGRGFRRAHVDLVAGLLEACRAQGVGRLLQISALNAGKGASHYLRTRGEAEALVRKAADTWDLTYTVFRPSVIFGPDDTLLNRFAGLLRISPVLPLARAGTRFAPVYVGDVVEAMTTALHAPAAAHNATLELCGPESMTLRKLVCWVRDTLGLRRAVIGLPEPLGWLQGRVMDFVPGKPFSSENFRSLEFDSVCSADGLATLGIRPHTLTRLAPTWLGATGKQRRYQSLRRAAHNRDRSGGESD